MDKMRAVINFAILNANRRNGKNYLDSLVPFAEELFIRKQYEEVNINQICQDFAKEFLFKIPVYPMKVVLKRLVRMGKLTYCHNNVWKPKKLDDRAVVAVRKEYERNYDVVVQSFCAYMKSQFNEDVSLDLVNNALIGFLEKQDANLLFFAKKDLMLFPKVDSEKKMIRRFAMFLQKEAESNSEIFQYVVEIASGHIVASTIVNEEKQLHEEKVQKVKIYCDTSHILKLLGLDGDIPQRMVEDLFRVLSESKCQLVLFRHTYNEIIHNIENAKKWFRDPNCDMTKASRTTLYFIENNYSDLDVEKILNSIDDKLTEFDVSIEDTAYLLEGNDGQTSEDKLRTYIINEYKANNEDFDENNKRFLLDNDVRSITMVYRSLHKKFPRRFKDLKTVFMCANSSLAKACRTYHLEVEEPGRENFIPVCVTDTFLGTYIWLQSPQDIDRLAKAKIVAEVYAILQPTDSVIRKYLTEVQQGYKRGEISEDDYYLLRATSVINEILSENIDSVELVTDKTPTEILEKIKSQSREEGLRKYYEMRDQYQKVVEDNKRKKDDREIRKNKKKQNILSCMCFIFDLVMGFLIFVLIIVATFVFSRGPHFLKWGSAIILGLCSFGSFWGFARGQRGYENLKDKFIRPLSESFYRRIWDDV